MYHPTSRVLTVLELLQSRPSITGPELAARLEMDVRTVRRYITHRKVEPYGITGWKGHWYLGGYCCLRQDYRSFRLDRIQQLQILTETFEKAEDFDFEAFVKEQYNAGSIHMEVEFQAELSAVQQKIPTLYGTLTETPTGVLLQEQYDDVDSMARYLMALNLPFIIHHPPELREALLRLGERMVQIATVPLPPRGT